MLEIPSLIEKWKYERTLFCSGRDYLEVRRKYPNRKVEVDIHIDWGKVYYFTPKRVLRILKLRTGKVFTAVNVNGYHGFFRIWPRKRERQPGTNHYIGQEMVFE
jgi:hypothetical protein